MIVRKAKNDDRMSIALCIAEAFEKDFAILCKNTNTILFSYDEKVKCSNSKGFLLATI